MADWAEGLDEFRSRLFVASLEAYQREHQELSTLWNSLDTKAQGIAGIAGIFLAGAFGFARDLTTLPRAAQGFLLLTVVALITSVILALFALKLRIVAAPPSGEQIHDMAVALADPRDPLDLSATLVAFYADTSRLWTTAISDLKTEVASKGRFVWFGQVALAVAIGFSAVLLIGVLA